MGLSTGNKDGVTAARNDAPHLFYLFLLNFAVFSRETVIV